MPGYRICRFLLGMTVAFFVAEQSAPALTLGIPTRPSGFPLQVVETNGPLHPVAWGANNFKQTEVTLNLTNLVQIASSSSGTHNVGLLDNGTVIAWGKTNNNRCNVPRNLGSVVQVAAGQNHSLALKADGTIVAWGFGWDGQTDVPQDLPPAVEVEGGVSHTVALLQDGTVAAWGDNSKGQCDIPPDLTNVVQIASGSYFTVALSGDGKVSSWGRDLSDPPVPFTNPVGLRNLVQVAAGGSHAVALKNDATVVAWGDDSSGQCDVPPGLTNVIQVGAGANHSLALKTDGSIVAWGETNDHQCDVPLVLTNAVQISAGSQHSLALATRYAQPSPAPLFINLSNTASLLLTFTNANQSSSDSVSLISGPARFSNNSLTFTGAGTIVLSNTFAGNGYYLPATNVTSSIVLTLPKTQTNISFNCPTNIPYQTSPFALSAVFSSHLSATFSAQGTNVLRCESNKLFLLGLGTTTVTASQSGNYSNTLTGNVSGFWAAAEPVSRQVTVTPGLNSISDPAPSAALAVGMTFALTNTNSSANLPVSYTLLSGPALLSNNLLKPTNSGTIVVVSSQNGNSLYQAAAFLTSTIVATSPQTQSIFFSLPGTVPYSTNPIPLTATSSSVLPVTYRVDNTNVARISGTNLLITGIGTATVTASQIGNYFTNTSGTARKYWLPAPDITATLEVVFKGSQTISFPPLGAIPYSSNPVPLEASASSGLPVTYVVGNTNVAAVVNNVLVLSGVGTTTIIAMQNGTGGENSQGTSPQWNPAVPVTNSLVIIPGNQFIPTNIVIPPLPEKTPFTLPLSNSSAGLPLSYTVVSGPAILTNGALLPTGTGTVVLAADQPGNPNISAATRTTFSIVVRKAQSISPFGRLLDVTYTPNQTIKLSVPVASPSKLPVSLSLVSGPANLMANVLTITNVGRITIAANQDGNSNYAAAPQTTASFTVKPIVQTIGKFTLKNIVFEPKKQIIIPTPAASSGLPVSVSLSSNSLSFADLLQETNSSQLTIKGAGTVTVTATQSGNSFYLPVSGSVSFVVAKAPQTIAPFTKLANVSLSTRSLTIASPTSSSGLPVTVAVKSGPAKVGPLTNGLVTFTNKGTITLTADQSGNQNYLPAKQVMTTFTVQ